VSGRSGFTGNVALASSNLPSGVTASSARIPQTEPASSR
jgi:hypothetical protein